MTKPAFGSPPGPYDPLRMASVSNIWQPRFSSGDRYFKLFVSHTSAYKREVGLLSLALSDHGIAGL
jgi:hypothetical protein